jgi:hypothetical protein
MKKLLLVSGYLASVCMAIALWGMFHKMAFSTPALMAGAILFIVVYTPIFLMTKFKENADPVGKFSVLISSIAAVLALVGIYMNIEVTNYASTIAHFASLLILICAIITAFSAFRQSDSRLSVNLHNTAILLIIALSFFVFIWKTRTPNQILADFDQIIMTQNDEIMFFENKSNSIFENLDKSPGNSTAAAAYYQKSLDVKAKSDSLVGYLQSIGEEMMYKTDGNPISFDSISNLHKRANRKIGKEMMITEKRDSIYLLRLAEFKSFIEPNTNSRGKELLDMFFTVNDTIAYKIDNNSTSWNYYRFNKSVIGIIADFNADILHIRMLESETLNYLQTMQARSLVGKE